MEAETCGNIPVDPLHFGMGWQIGPLDGFGYAKGWLGRKEHRPQEDRSVRFGRGSRSGVFDAVEDWPQRLLGVPQLELRPRSRRGADPGSFGSRPLHRTN